MNGKGSRNRTADLNAFREGYERIFAKSKPAEPSTRPEEGRSLKQTVADMENFSNRLYWTMFNEHWGVDCHAFLEFNGLVSKFVQLCAKAADKGIDFRHANKHSGEVIPMDDHDAAYLGEKFDCIFGPSLRANPKAMRAFLGALGITVDDQTMVLQDRLRYSRSKRRLRREEADKSVEIQLTPGDLRHLAAGGIVGAFDHRGGEDFIELAKPREGED